MSTLPHAALQQIAERLNALQPEKQALFLEQLAVRGIAFGKLPIVPAPRTETLSLSFAQRRLWFLWQLEPHSAAYHIPCALRLRGQLDTVALNNALTSVVARHEALRTRFPSVDGQATQVIDPPAALLIEHLDLSDFPLAEREARAQALAVSASATPFDLEHGPLLRVSLLQLAADDHVLLLTLHHIVADGWSLNLLVAQFAEQYSALVQGASTLPAPLPIQYADYSVWQQRLLAAGERDRQLNYWQGQLGGEQPILELPLDQPRPTQPSGQGASVAFNLPEPLGRQLRDLARRHGASLFHVLLSTFQVLLYRHSGQADVRVGVPVANRHRDETRELIGLFVNTQVLRSELHAEQTFSELLTALRDTALAAQDHQDLPFEVLVDALAPERNVSRSPLFQVMFNHQQRAFAELDGLPGLRAEVFAEAPRNARFDLCLDTEEDADGQLRATFTYAVELFSAARIEGLREQFLRLLEQVQAAPHKALADLLLLTPAQRQAILATGNDTARPFPKQALHRLFEAQVQRTPQAIAVSAGGEELSYAQLNARANQLARRLIEWGVGPDTLVGVALERTPQLLVGLLAVLKAGGAYVPLDPEYPEERLALMLDDSRARWILTQETLLPQFAHSAARIFCLDRDWPPLAALPATDVSEQQRPAHPEQLAYCIYTSGSTGTPKGVAVRHSSLVNFLASMTRTPGMEANDRVLGLTSLSFDIAALELYLPLLCGARVVLVDRDVARDPQALSQVIRDQAVSLVQATPSTWRLLLDGGQPQVLAGLTLLSGGEPLADDLATRLLALSPRLWNLYGPTETTIWSAHWALSLSAPLPWLGVPLENTVLHVLDERLEPVPHGVAGELYIGGAGLARGYWQRPGLSSERFVADPFGSAGERLYRTGDLARYGANGVLVYLGRIDQQVKLRGYRIEPGEIEARMLEHPGVREAAVVLRDTAQGRQLVSYVVGIDDAELPALRARLVEVLPEHMVPAQSVVLDALPRTPNGKLDRKALPAPAGLQPQTLYSAPNSAAERVLAQIWQGLLGVEQVGLEDNFFALGGDSISSIQMVSRARTAGWVIAPRQVFQFRTLGLLAAAARAVDGVARVQLQPFALADLSVADRERLPMAELEDAYPLTPLQYGLLFHARHAATADVYVNQLRVDVQGLDEGRFHQAWQVTLAAHPGLRVSLDFANREQPLQLIHRQLNVPLTVVDGLAFAAEDLEHLARKDRERGFDLAQAPLLRLTLVRTGSARHHLLYTSHHILLDGWSTSQLLGEVLKRYAGADVGADGEAGHPREFLAWLQQRDLAADEAFWREQLVPLAQPTRLAQVLPRTTSGRGGAGESHRRLDAERTARLETFARNTGVTLNTLVQAAWALLLQRCTGQRTVVFGATVAGRPAQLPGIERQLGLFINTLPLVVTPASEHTVGQWLLAVQETSLAMREHEHTALAQIQHWAGQGGAALFDSLLVFENYPLSTVLQQGADAGVVFGPVASDERTHYAFTLIVVPGAELTLSGKYPLDAFDQWAGARLLECLETVLLALAENPLRSVGDVPLLNLIDHQRQVEQWNRWTDQPDALTLHQRFERQAAAAPEALALIHGQQSMSYGELNAQANRLAHRLRARGVGPGVKVGIALPRTADLPVGLLAILKAGGTYIPLDPAYPAERVAYMLQDSGAALLLTRQHLLAQLPAHAAVQLLDEDLSSWPDQDPLPMTTLDELVYVIYTSGSTGRPKGVAITHHSASALVQWSLATYAREELDGVLASTSVCFDLSVWEFFVTLSAGGYLLLADNALALAELPARNQVRLINTVPSAIAALLRSGQIPDSVRVINLAGEALQQCLVDELYALGHVQHVYDLYGPSEDTTYSTWTRREAGGQANIGRPLSWTRSYVLDADLHPLPEGVAGELYLAGAKLAQGYLGRPGLTAERFVASPFEPGERLYRTGDLVRYGAQGVIEYVGRIDHQVKIRGFRIELGEIEARLLAHPQVREAAVLAGDDNGVRQLIAYVAADASDNLRQSLEAFLRESLPEHMVPAQWVILEALPQTPNGKLDRKALPAPQVVAAHYCAPQNALQMQLVGIWQALLGLERVGITDDFFELGGHSLLATQLLSRLQRELRVDLSLAEVFGCTTVLALAELIERRSVPVDSGKLSRMSDLMAALEDR
jgi:amino acid adenylation domain-containing protein